MTTRQIRIRLTTDEMKELQQLADSCDLNTASLAAIFVKSALRSIKENGGRLVLPLRFTVEEPKTKK